MRFYQRRAIDIRGSIERCRFDAEQGKISLALERTNDLSDEFQDHADLAYAEGLLRAEFLGQGLMARSLFERAYHLAPPKSRTAYFAACNVAVYARDWKERRDWSKRALETEQRDPLTEHALRRSLLEAEPEKTFRDGIQLELEQLPETEFGKRAAHLEIALSTGLVLDGDEVKLRRRRAQTLRQLDSAAEASRSRLGETFPPEERLALLEAVAELQTALQLDPWDAELWNLRSAWCIKLDRFDEALSDAERASELRPHQYLKPFINKAHALAGLGRHAEAQACARQALEQARRDGAADDERLAQSCLEFMRRYPGGMNVTVLDEVVNGIPRAANLVTAPGEMARHGVFKKANTFFIMDLVRRRAKNAGAEWSLAYVRIMAELLSDYTPETAFVVICYLAQRIPQVGNHALLASLYIVAHSDGVRRRDAARFYLLNLFAQAGRAEQRRRYRHSVLAWAVAAKSLEVQAPRLAAGFAQLDSVMRDEMRRIHPGLPQHLADQEPISCDEESYARKQLCSLFQGEVPQRLPPEAPTLSSMCRPLTGLLIMCYLALLEKPLLLVALLVALIFLLSWTLR